MKSLYVVQRWGSLAVLFLALSLIVVGCKDNGGTVAPVEDDTVMELINSNSNLKTLAGLLEGTGVEQTLSGSGNVTIFAPTDAAFAQLPQGYIQGLTNQQKLDILRYHVHSGEYSIINEIKKEAIPSLEGDELFLEIGQSFGNLLNGRAKFIATNIEADNGLIQVIDAVLLPDQLGTLADNIRKRYDYRSFSNRMEDAGMMAFLDTEGTKTLLAAPDLAVDALEGQLRFDLTDEQWKEIMSYHLLNQDISGAGPGTKTELVTLTGEAVYLTVDQPGQYVINHNQIPVEWISSTNGDILFTEGVMLPDKYLDVLSLMDRRFNLQVTRNAFTVARLTGTLYNTSAQYTVFVPSDDATGLDTWPSTEAELANILKYHVINTKLMAGDFEDNQSYTTWQGGTITVKRNGNVLTINDTATIMLADLQARNGVVHVLNGTLTPPAN